MQPMAGAWGRRWTPKRTVMSRKPFSSRVPLEEVARRYLAGETMKALAAECGYAPKSLYLRLVREGLLSRAPKQSRPRSPVGRDEFADIWNAAATVDEAAVCAGLTRTTAINRATRYRKDGIVMKIMPCVRRTRELPRHTYESDPNSCKGRPVGSGLGPPTFGWRWAHLLDDD